MTIVKATGEKEKKAHSITLQNREKLVITGIDKVKSANDRGVLMVLPNTTLTITGSNLQVNQFDITTGMIEIVGNVEDIRYGQSKPLLKRLFR